MLSPQARDLANLSTFPRRRLYQAMDVPGVKSAESLYINFIDWKNPQTQDKIPILVVGMNPERSALNLPEINQNLDKIKLPDTVLFDRASRRDYQKVIAVVMFCLSGAIATRKLQAADPADIFSRALSAMQSSSNTNIVISIQHLDHYFGLGQLRKQVLFDINLEIGAGEIVIMTRKKKVQAPKFIYGKRKKCISRRAARRNTADADSSPQIDGVLTFDF